MKILIATTINVFVLMCLFMSQPHAGIVKGLALEEVTQGEFPVAFISPKDGSSAMFIVEKAGIIKKYEDDVISLFLDIRTKVNTTHIDQGLLGLAFDPNYHDNGYFYVNYTGFGGQFNEGVTIIERYQNTQLLNPDKSLQMLMPMAISIDTTINNAVIDSKNSQVILEIDQFSSIHNGGTMAFDNNNYLYIATGDGGGRMDPNNYSQNLGELLGKMLRIDVNPDIVHKSTFEKSKICGNSNYQIPNDNPFISDSDACDEIFFYGLRSPWKWSFDRLTDDIFIGDVGQANAEEVSFIPSTSTGGENLGWSCKEGFGVLIRERCPNSPTLTDPIISYNHNPDNSGNSIVGGYRYRGKDIKELQGTYIYTDTISGDTFFAQFIDNQWISELWDEKLNFVVSFAEDNQGNLYTVSLNGSIKKFVIKE